MNSVDLNLLPALDALLSKRNVTAAAKSLGLSQPTMSGILARLREQFHDPLLVRVGRGMELTSRAAALKPEVRQILLSLDKLTLQQAELNEGTQRHFTIMTSEFGLFLLLPHLAQQITASGMRITLRAVAINQPIDSIFNGVVDLCITGDRIETAGVEASRMVRTRTLMHDRFVGIVDPGHPLREPVTLDQILAFPRVAAHFEGSDHAAEDVAIAHLSERRPPACRVPSFLAIAPIVAGSPAIGLAPSRLAPRMASHDAIRTIELPSDFDPLAIKMLWHKRFDNDPAHSWLRGSLADLGRTLDADAPKLNGAAPATMQANRA